MIKLPKIKVPDVLQNVVGVRVQATIGSSFEEIEDLAHDVLLDENGSGHSLFVGCKAILNLKTGLLTFDGDRMVGSPDVVSVLTAREHLFQYFGTPRILERTIAKLHHSEEAIKEELDRNLKIIEQDAKELQQALKTDGIAPNVNGYTFQLSEKVTDCNLLYRDLADTRPFAADVPYNDFCGDDWWEDDGKFSIITDPHLETTDKPTHIVFFDVEVDTED